MSSLWQELLLGPIDGSSWRRGVTSSASGYPLNTEELGFCIAVRFLFGMRFTCVEERLSLAPTLSREQDIIALAGGVARFKEAGHLARLYPDAKVLLSDKNTMTDALAELGGGVDPSRIELETRSHNTYEDASFCADLVKPTPQQRWLLVTSAVHMSRTLASFRAAGFDVEPWPVYDDGLPERTKLTQAMHEWLGLLVYRALGRTDQLLPKPHAT